MLAHTRIIPYRGEIVVLLDRRLYRFDRQGNWLNSLSFPRSRSDGIYDRTPAGENSLIIDEATSTWYLVQGYRILAIDLSENEVTTVFRQNDSDIGMLVRHQGSIYFLLHSNGEDRYRIWSNPQAEMYTEMIKMDLQTHELQRYMVQGYYDALEIEADPDGQPLFTLIRYN
jgi:hypothetical protein